MLAGREKSPSSGQGASMTLEDATILAKCLRDLTTPIFLKLFANPKTSEWMSSYRINWQAVVVAQVPTSGEDRKAANLARTGK
jgi:hypothetical protein